MANKAEGQDFAVENAVYSEDDYSDEPIGGPDPDNPCPKCGAVPDAPADGSDRSCAACGWNWSVDRPNEGWQRSMEGVSAQPGIGSMSSQPGRGVMAFFRTDNPTRDNFVARLFGTFSESIVRAWADLDDSSYSLLGERPTIHPASGGRWTLDFLLKRQADGAVFVAEMKAWTAFDNYRYLILENSDQIRRVERYSPGAMGALLELNRHPSGTIVTAGGQPVDVSGGILVWSAVAPAGRAAAMSDPFAFADVLSIEDMLNMLRLRRPEAWTAQIDALRRASIGLFDFLSM